MGASQSISTQNTVMTKTIGITTTGITDPNMPLFEIALNSHGIGVNDSRRTLEAKEKKSLDAETPNSSHFYNEESVISTTIEGKKSFWRSIKKSIIQFHHALKRPMIRVPNHEEYFLLENQTPPHVLGEFDIDLVQYNILANFLFAITIHCMSLNSTHIFLIYVICNLFLIFFKMLHKVRIAENHNIFLYPVSLLNFAFINIILLQFNDVSFTGTAGGIALKFIPTAVTVLILGVYMLLTRFKICKNISLYEKVYTYENEILIGYVLYFLLSCKIFMMGLFNPTALLSYHYSLLILIMMSNTSFMILKMVKCSNRAKGFIPAVVMASLSVFSTVFTGAYGFSYQEIIFPMMDRHLN